jgi:CRISPR-associated protein Csm2
MAQTLQNWSKPYSEKLRNLSNVSAMEIVEISKSVGEFLASGSYLQREGDNKTRSMGVKVSQIRRFLDAIRRIENELKSKDYDQAKDSVILLRPKLAYAAGRQEAVKALMYILDPAIQSAAQSDTADNFNKLLRLIEGIIAYHRLNGGKDS